LKKIPPQSSATSKGARIRLSCSSHLGRRRFFSPEVVYADKKHVEVRMLFPLPVGSQVELAGGPVNVPTSGSQASPVYANFSGGYIPTLIQGGTKEIFLSDFVRLYQALDQTGIPVKLDIYEGMPHVHQYLYNTPESEVALSKLNDFLRANLDY
jgi:acetyl esterase/lipase